MYDNRALVNLKVARERRVILLKGWVNWGSDVLKVPTGIGSENVED